MPKLYIAFLFTILLTGCARNAYDRSGKVVKMCPVHDTQLKAAAVRTVYGLPRPPSEEYRKAQARNFPYAATPSLKGCIVTPLSSFNRYDSVMACPTCTKSRKEYLKESKSDSGAY